MKSTDYDDLGIMIVMYVCVCVCERGKDEQYAGAGNHVCEAQPQASNRVSIV